MINYTEGFIKLNLAHGNFPQQLRSSLEIDLPVLSELGCRLEGDCYYLCYEAVYAIYLNVPDKESNLVTRYIDLEKTGTPKFQNIKVIVKHSSGTLRNQDVLYTYAAHNTGIGTIRINTRRGMYVETDHGPILLEPAVARLFDAIDSHQQKVQDKLFVSSFDHAVSCSNINNLTRLAHAQFTEGALTNTELMSFDKLPVKIGFDSDGNVDVNIDLGRGNQINADFMKSILDCEANKDTYTFKQGGKRRRIYLSQQCREAASRLFKARSKARADGNLGEIAKLAEEIIELQSKGGEDAAFELILADYAQQVLGFTHEKLRSVAQKSVSIDSDELFENQENNYVIHTKEDGINITVNLDDCRREYEEMYEKLKSPDPIILDDLVIPHDVAKQFIDSVNQYHSSRLNQYTAEELESLYNSDKSNFLVLDDIPIFRDVIYDYICKLRDPQNEVVEQDAHLIHDEEYIGVMGNAPSWDYATEWNNYPLQINSFNLMEHQRKGWAQMKWLFDHRASNTDGQIHRGMLLADDMGVGKTLQVISFINQLLDEDSNGNPILIVAPISLIQNAWFKDLRKFAPHLLTKGLVKKWDRSIFKDCLTLDQRIYAAQRIIPATYKVLIINYEAARLYHKELAAVPFRAVFLDEAQHIKNISSGVSNALKCYKSNFYCAMTGTPVENSLLDLFSIMEFVQDKRLGTRNEFDREFCAPLRQADPGSSQRENLRKSLLRRLGPLWLRRTKEEVITDLPKKSDINWRTTCAEMSEFQKDLYKNELAKHSAARSILAVVAPLQRISSSPWDFKPDVNMSDLTSLVKLCPKLGLLINILKKIQAKREKVLIFSKYVGTTKGLSLIISQEFNIIPKLYYGKLPPATRQYQMKQFENSPEDEFDVMIINPKIAGFGITLTNANHVIHYTREWNPAIEEQATCRAYRKGQAREVFVYRPTSVFNQDPSSTEYDEQGQATMDVYLAKLNDMKNSVIDDFTFTSTDAERWLRDNTNIL